LIKTLVKKFLSCCEKMIQYFDMMREVGAQSKSNMVFVPHSPGSMGNLHDQLRETVFAGEAFKKSLDQ